MSGNSSRNDWRRLEARIRAGVGAAFLGAAVVIVLLRAWSTHQPPLPMLCWLALFMASAGMGAALGGALVSRISVWQSLRVPWWRCAARTVPMTVAATAVCKAVFWDPSDLNVTYLWKPVALGAFVGVWLLFAERIVPVLRLALSGLRGERREAAREAIRRHERDAAEQFLREEGQWLDAPAELIAAEAPAGRGTEPESASEPAGRGTELEGEAGPPPEAVRQGRRSGPA